MFRFSTSILPQAACIMGVLLLSACSPKYNWREVRGTDAPFMVMLPAKPASHTRPINLDGTEVTMTMTAAEVDDVAFAVGTAELPEPASTQQALQAMKRAMVRNINGTIVHENASGPESKPAVIEIEAVGPSGNRSGRRLLLARFIAQEQRIYQVIVVGQEDDVSREAADTFFTSFKLY